MRKLTLLMVVLAIALTNTFFKCVRECFPTDVPVKATITGVSHLDNRGASPHVLNPGSQGWREAYGFRLFATSTMQNPADTVGAECLYYFLSPSFTDVSIVTRTGLGTQYPPGAVVSTLFKYVQSDRYYREIAGAPSYFGFQWSNPGMATCDFLLLQAPDVAGWQQLEIRFQQSDTTSFSIVTDSVYLQ